MNFVLKTRKCALKTRNFVLKTRNCALKTRKCAFNMMYFAGPGGGNCDWCTCVDDLSFLQQVVDMMLLELCVDQSRVYATGESNGGMLLWDLLAQTDRCDFDRFSTRCRLISACFTAQDHRRRAVDLSAGPGLSAAACAKRFIHQFSTVDNEGAVLH